MPDTRDGLHGRAEATADLLRAYVDLIKGPEPRGLELLRGLRSALTDLYAAMLGIPPCKVAPVTTVHVRTDSDVLAAEAIAGLDGRLPPDLYWSDLLPLTWETVGDVGVSKLTDALAEIYAHLKDSVTEFDLGAKPDEMFYGWELELDLYWRTLLSTFSVLHELVTDLEMYARG